MADTGFHKMTVAKVYEKNPAGYTVVVFLESARFYKLLCSNVRYESYLLILKDAEKKKTSVIVKFTEDIIQTVKKNKFPADPKKNHH